MSLKEKCLTSSGMLYASSQMQQLDKNQISKPFRTLAIWMRWHSPTNERDTCVSIHYHEHGHC